MKTTIQDTLIALVIVIIFIVIPVLKIYEQTTVLEVSNKGDYQRVTYTERTIFESRTDYIEFETSAGVDTYINEIADYDYSQWKFN